MRHHEKTDKNKTEKGEYELPPRSTLHSHDRNKPAKLFYLGLFAVFLILTVVLIGWGLSLQPQSE